MEQTAASTSKGQGRAPPYFAFTHLSTLIHDLNANGTPPKIDRGTMAGIPNTVKAQLMTGLRFLDLVNTNDEPTEALGSLVSSYGTDQFAEALQPILRRSYQEIFKLDLMSVTPSHLFEAFKVYVTSDDVRRKVYVFFLTAVREARIPVGNRLAQKSKRGGGLPQKRRAKAAKKEMPNGTNGTGGLPPPPPPPTLEVKQTAMVDALLAKFPPFDPEWPDPLKAKWFAGFEKFMAMASPKSSGGN